jgi:ABC-type uncharacterized transport system substrate-binding protein
VLGSTLRWAKSPLGTMKRRNFMKLLGGAVLGLPQAVGAREGGPGRRVGVLVPYAEGDEEGRDVIAALKRGLQDFGWVEGRNIWFDVRWAAGDSDKARSLARELIALAPDVIVPSTNLVTTIMLEETRTIPVVFFSVGDPVGSDYVGSMARPGGNATGFAVFENAIAGKWLHTLLELAPRLSRIGFILHPETPANIGMLHAAQSAAPSSAKVIPLGVRNTAAIERAVSEFAMQPQGALIVAPHAVTFANRDSIVELASRFRLPALYPFRIFAVRGGLVSYGTNPIEMWRQGASYVDRVLKGEKPADLPAQFPTKYELVLNLKTARTLGIEIPASLLARADEVIE